MKKPTYVELATELFEAEDLYLSFAEIASDLSFSEARDLFGELEYFHGLLLNLKENENLNFSEGDFSFAGVMNFVKALSNGAAKGMERHNAAMMGLDPSKLGDRAYDFLSNVASNVDGKIAQQQYKKMLGEDDERSGAEKFQQFIMDGWDRHKTANKKIGTWSGKQEAGHQNRQQNDRELLDYFKKNRMSRGKDSESMDYFLDDNQETDDPWDGEQSQSSKSYKNQDPEKSQALLPPGKPKEYNLTSMKGFKPTGKTMDDYSKGYQKKKNQQLVDRLRRYQDDNPDYGYSEMNRYQIKYLNALDEIQHSRNPKQLDFWNREAAVNEALMVYAEAYQNNDQNYVQELVNSALKLVTQYEGLNFSESKPSVRQTLTKAALYNYSEQECEDYAEDEDYADSSASNSSQMPDNDYSKKIKALRDKLQHQADMKDVWGSKEGYAEEEDDNSMVEQLEAMFDQLSEEERAELLEYLEEDGNESSQKKPDAKKQDDSKDDSDTDYSDCDRSMSDYGDSSSYSEKLASHDKALEDFVGKCKLTFSEFDYVNDLYNNPDMSYSENVNYDFSEWMSAFRKANSAAFNLFGNRCQFNGNLPSSIHVTPTNDYSEAAWEITDDQDRFVTYAGIKQFKDLAFSENFKKVFCKSSQGSTLKSDRIARSAFCLR